MVAGLVYIDNYDEVIDSVEEVRQSLLMALIDRKINQYIANFDGIVKKLENDKYFVVIKKESFKQLEKDSFSLLDDVKCVSIGKWNSGYIKYWAWTEYRYSMRRVITMHVLRLILRLQEAAIRQLSRTVTESPIMVANVSRQQRIPV